MNENGNKSESEIQSDRNKLRSCWELASVLNFLQVFEPIIGSELKIDAEEIEQALILPDRRLRLLHIALLKQHDVIAYINDAVKAKKEISVFRKNNIGEDGKGTSYWLDGNEIIGLRLYKEDEYSSSKSKLEVAVSAAVGTQAIPILNKMFKKKQRELEKKLKEERIMNNFSRSGITRSCRNRNPIRYTFDEYDKVISEAIRDSNKMKTRDEQKGMKKETVAKEQAGEVESTESDKNAGSEDSGKESDENVGSEDSGQESDKSAVSKDSGEESDENAVTKESGEESEENYVSEDSGEESDENVASEASGEELDEIVVSEASGDESDENVVSDASGEESDDNVVPDTSSDESDENEKEKMNLNSSKDRKMKFRDQQRIKKKETVESEEEDGESTGSDLDIKSSKLETKDISKYDDDNKENTRNISKKNTDNGDRLIQQKQHFGTKKRLIQRPNRNTALESAIVPDSEDEVSSGNSDD
ncbi:hypothetical protein M8C21_018147 [Ambrosia artemisiifolia]|uniref:Uncharacterized protein n=1 Tax=Ambrosia artemisiifolia TaxID=4212 RepID=A0AAD5BLP7_AMBAR|nr:hypothetical protein M8C21_018147 [Ambrosia artemisiifolia]